MTPEESPAWGYPDTVEVMVRGEVNASDVMDMRLEKPTRLQRAWLKKHSYVRVGREYDSTATADIAVHDPDDGMATGYFRLQYKRVD